MNAVAFRVRLLVLASPWTTAALVMTVALAVTVVVGLAVGAGRTATAPDRYTAAVGGDADAVVVQPSGRPIDELVRALPQVQELDGVAFIWAGPAEGRVNTFIASQGLGLRGRLVEGRAASPTVAEEFTANAAFLETYDVGVGDHVPFISYSQAQIDRGLAVGLSEPPGGPPIDAVLVGVTTAPEHLDDPTPAAYFSPALLEQPVATGGTHMVVTLAPETSVEDLAAALESVPGHEELFFDSGLVVSESLRDAVRAQAVGLWVLTLVAGIAVVAALGQLFVRHLAARAAEHRPLLAVGYTTSQVIVEQVAWAALVVGVGTVIGTALAAMASPLFPRGFVRQLDPQPGDVRFDTGLLAFGSLLVAALLVAWVAVGAAASRRRPAVERSSAVADALARTGLAPSAVTGVRFALGRARDSASPLNTLATLGVGIGGVVAAVVVASSVGRLVSDPARFGTNFDAVISNGFGAGQPVELPSLDGEPGVRGATRTATTSASTDGGDVTIVGVEPVRGGLQPRVVDGSFPAAPDEIALGGVTARRLGLDIGDRMTLTSGSGTSMTYGVVGMVVMPAPSFGQGGGHGAAMLMSGLQRLEPEVVPDSLVIRLEPGAQLPPTLEGFLVNQASELPPPADIVNVDRARPVPVVLAIVVGALAMLTLAHALITSVRRRRRDLAVLRTLGASRRWVGWVVHAQASALALIAVVIGVPLGILGGRLVFRAFADRLGLVSDPATPVALLAATVTAVIVVGNLAASVPAWRARRISLPGLLRAE